MNKIGGTEQSDEYSSQPKSAHLATEECSHTAVASNQQKVVLQLLQLASLEQKLAQLDVWTAHGPDLDLFEQNLRRSCHGR